MISQVFKELQIKNIHGVAGKVVQLRALDTLAGNLGLGPSSAWQLTSVCNFSFRGLSYFL